MSVHAIAPPVIHLTGQHRVAIERKTPADIVAVKHAGKPMTVVLPHLVKRNFLLSAPERKRFLGVAGLAAMGIGEEDGAVQRVSVGELKTQVGDGVGLQRTHPYLLPGFAHRRLNRRLIRFYTTARRVDLALAESSSLANQQQRASSAHEAEHRPVDRFPVRPFDRGGLGIPTIVLFSVFDSVLSLVMRRPAV